MTKVRKLNRLGMELKAAGKIAKFQVINRKGQPILQTGGKNQNYADYKGAEDEIEVVDNTPWTLVEGRRKRPHPESTLTSPNSRPLMTHRSQTNQPAPTAATWAALTEQEFPELVSQPVKQPQRIQQSAADSPRPPATSQLKKSTPASSKEDQQPKPSGDREETPRGSQPGSYPASRVSSRQSSRSSTPPPIRSIFDEDHSETVRKNMKPKPQRQPKSKIDQHRNHLRKDY
jgi:hypothetical protein